MNSKGQVLVLFMLLLPLVFMMLALIIDTGLLYIEKRHVDLVVKDTTEYGIKNINSVTEQELYDLLDRNLNDIKEKKIAMNDGILSISISLDKESAFSAIFGKDRYEIKSAYKGMIEQNSIRIVRG